MHVDITSLNSYGKQLHRLMFVEMELCPLSLIVKIKAIKLMEIITQLIYQAFGKVVQVSLIMVIMATMVIMIRLVAQVVAVQVVAVQVVISRVVTQSQVPILKFLDNKR